MEKSDTTSVAAGVALGGLECSGLFRMFRTQTWYIITSDTDMILGSLSYTLNFMEFPTLPWKGE